MGTKLVMRGWGRGADATYKLQSKGMYGGKEQGDSKQL